ncbi:hypothetical protein QQ020_35065 [Fulvivirgaceae bacterium BMA12]|uniref:Secreted protein n=1 Tax=Agaribacillus aureus TaxID=3051825 RepID=A0ABT8LHS2_9BACT|nr:hypothetical protein [Fulvivirgaceae bacterium BMA12]
MKKVLRILLMVTSIFACTMCADDPIEDINVEPVDPKEDTGNTEREDIMDSGISK